ncbi:MAG: AAA family ATPase [Selenomonadaceae bacterium]|nr:AAA family ATPase [Selenomonadaceae bacterium]
MVDRVQELLKENENLKRIIQNNHIYTLDDQIAQFISLCMVHMKRIITELRLEEYDPKNIERIKRLMNFFENLKQEVEKNIYAIDTLHSLSLDIKQTFLKGWLNKMKTVSFINFKGGVGKTTISVNTAYALSNTLENIKVLFIDNDKQGNASNWLGADLSKGSIAHLMMGDATVKEIIQHTNYQNMDLIPADNGLIDVQSALIKNESVNQATILKNALKAVEKDYDICIVDNPPDINVSVLNALAITDEVVIVTTPDPDSLSGADQMLKQINMVKALNKRLTIRGILVNSYTSDDSTFTALDDLKGYELPIFKTKIHYATKSAKKNLILARRSNKTIFEQYPNCLVARDIWQFTKELLYIK